jgi:hypothetical protein
MPHVLPIFATLSWGANSPLPPALVPSQIERLQSKLKASEVRVDPAYVGKNMPHVFPIFATLSWGANNTPLTSVFLPIPLFRLSVYSLSSRNRESG